MSCDDISIDQFPLLFFSLSMRLLLFHLEYNCIVLWLIRLANCLKMGWSLHPKRHENTWFSWKIRISCTFLHLIDFLNDLSHYHHSTNSKGKLKYWLSYIFYSWATTPGIFGKYMFFLYQSFTLNAFYCAHSITLVTMDMHLKKVELKLLRR